MYLPAILYSRLAVEPVSDEHQRLCSDLKTVKTCTLAMAYIILWPRWYQLVFHMSFWASDWICNIVLLAPTFSITIIIYSNDCARSETLCFITYSKIANTTLLTETVLNVHNWLGCDLIIFWLTPCNDSARSEQFKIVPYTPTITLCLKECSIWKKVACYQRLRSL